MFSNYCGLRRFLRWFLDFFILFICSCKLLRYNLRRVLRCFLDVLIC